MKRIAYAVVKEDGANYRFSKFHDTEQEAQAEAERLCRKERKSFLILKLIGFCHIEEVPVKTVVFS